MNCQNNIVRNLFLRIGTKFTKLNSEKINTAKINCLKVTIVIQSSILDVAGLQKCWCRPEVLMSSKSVDVAQKCWCPPKVLMSSESVDVVQKCWCRTSVDVVLKCWCRTKVLMSYRVFSILGSYFEFKNVYNFQALLLNFIRLSFHSHRTEF